MARITSHIEASGPSGEKKNGGWSNGGSTGGLPEPIDDDEGRSAYIRPVRAMDAQSRHSRKAPRRKPLRF
ncbi:MAG TPA: hypothetical protein VFR09_02865 [Alphaproteobacteria bacterium]|nr:hypothetical protein [Alphaproteobacteria bacterium]